MLRLALLLPAVVCGLRVPVVKPQTANCAAGKVTELALDRRSLLGAAAASVLAPRAASAAGSAPSKVVVLGGAGYVGSHVAAQLLDAGVGQVVIASRSSPQAQADRVAANLGWLVGGSKLSKLSFVQVDAASGNLGPLLAGAGSVVSCVGVLPGSPTQREGNGAVNVRIADAAKAAGVGRFVYVSVDQQLASSPAKFVLGGYFAGKAEAEAAIAADFGAEKSLVLRPAILAGGPPGETRPPGPPGFAAVSVDAVASAAVAGALGKRSGVLDGAAGINAAA